MGELKFTDNLEFSSRAVYPTELCRLVDMWLLESPQGISLT